jgi:hypothetical protein
MTNVFNRIAMLAALSMSVSAAVPAFAQTTPTTTDTNAPAAGSWVNHITLGGDLRFRVTEVETAVGSPTTGGEHTSEQVRMRLALQAKVNDYITGNVRIASGAGGNLITSSNQNLDGYEAKKNLSIDVASIDYVPMAGLSVSAGKTVNPFFAAGKNEMIFDVDLTMEGVNAKYLFDGGAFKPFVTLEHSILVQTTGGPSTPDTTLFGAQLGTTFNTPMFGITAAISSYTYNNLKDHAVVANQLTNSTNGGTTYAFAYKLLNAELEATTDVLPVRLSLYGSYVRNSDPGDHNTGFLAGLRFGMLKDPGSWTVDYNYRNVQKDATLSAFTDSDTAGGGTDQKAHRIALQYAVWPSTTLGLTTSFAKRNISAATGEVNYQRYMLEALTTF